MSNGNHETSNKQERLLRNRVARAIFSAADAVGISDRERIEQLTDQIISRLESPPLPGMEHLAPKVKTRSIAEARIQSLVKSLLAESKPTPPSSSKPQPEVSARIAVRDKETVGSIPLTTSGAVVSPNARAVLGKRYLIKDSQGQVIETVDQMFRRVAHHIASADALYDPKADVKAREEEFYQLMAKLEFLPNTPTLMNAGQELGQLSACFVLPIDDSMESIFDAVKYTALIHKSGGGTGFSFSRLRPEGDLVSCTGGVASGPVSFMRAFDAATDVIKQGGKRRGANMAILNVDHPDILKFISAKKDNTSLTNFNISVAVTEEFMKAVESGSDYDLFNPRIGREKPVGKLNAKEVFDQIVDMAWRNGDPGIIFIDRIKDDNPTRHLGEIESTNPCGEQPLLPYESCNLGSINLSKMALEDKSDLDWPKLASTVRTAVRFLDNVIDVNKFPLPQIEEMTKKTRKIGLGVMGFADLLNKLEIPYDSEPALNKAGDIMYFIQEAARGASKELAEERGVFPAFAGSIYDKPPPDGRMVRNATRTTIAPTGTLSIIAGCSSGIEPLFALSYRRTILEGTQLLEVNPLFEETAKREGFYSEELMRSLANGASLREMENIPEKWKQLFVTAHDITPEWHVKMQAAFQEQTCNAVSKTVNFPYHATRENVRQVYMLAYEKKCKGITIYRDRSRDRQVLSTGETKPSEEKSGEGTKLVPRKRPSETIGRTRKVTTGCGNLYVTVNYDEEHKALCEVFSTLGKAGGCASAQLEAISRLTSLALRSGVGVESIIKQLKGIRCPSIAWESGHAILSCADAIGGVLERQHGDGKVEDNPKAGAAVKNLVGQCPDCGNLLIFQEGCFLCPGCGYTKC